MKVSWEVVMLEFVVFLLIMVFQNVIYAGKNSEIHIKEISYHQAFTSYGYISWL
jgi:hypothetical protein